VNKQLAALTSTALLVFGAFASAPAQALPIFGTESDHDLQMILDKEVELDFDQQNVLYGLSGYLALSPDSLLQDPTQMSSLYAGTSVDSSSPPTGGMVLSKEGCSVEAGCALKAIGLVNSLKCASSGMDPESWAKCLRDTDYDSYLAAAACTWGSCPGFSAVPGEGLYACADSDTLGVFASSTQLSDSISID